MQRPWLILIASSSLGFSQEKVSYDDHIFPIFQQACLNCHNPDKTKGGLDLSSYSATLKGSSGGKIVEAGELASSLIAVVEHSAEPVMPPEGDKLAANQISLLKQWIEGGLLENKSSAARKPSKPKFETALRSDPAAKPDGPPPMPEHLLLEPPLVTARPSAVRAIATSPWAPLLAVTGQRQVLLHHTETLELIGILPFPEGEPVSLNFTPDARYLIVGGGVAGKSGLTVSFDVSSGSRLLTIGKEFDSILAADIRPSFDRIASGGPSRLLKIWNTETGELVKSVKKHTDWITALDISADGVLLASGDRNGGVWVWESETCNEFHTLRGHQAAITATAFRADSNVLATASADGTVLYWEMNAGSTLKKNTAHAGGVTAFAFGRDGASLTAGRDLKLKLWKPDFNHARDLAKDLPALPCAVALDSEGKRAFVADADGVVRAFQTSDGKALGEIRSNPPAIASRLQQLTTDFKNLAASPTASTPATQAQVAHLQSALKRWTAAEINTRALVSHRAAEAQALELEDEQSEFTQHAGSITEHAARLNAKRSEAEHLEAALETETRTTAHHDEIRATLAAVQIRVAQEAAALKQAEASLLAQREKIELAAPQAHQTHNDSLALKHEYLKSLGEAK
jgi:hypothetical protein